MSTPLTSCNWGLRLELAASLREVSQGPENLLLGRFQQGENTIRGLLRAL